MTAEHTDRIPGLARAFLHQSLAGAKNRVRAQKAAQQGDRAAALVFAALADAQDIHAKKALLFLRGRIEDTAHNRVEALLEIRELAADMATWATDACCDRASAALLTQMARTLVSHMVPTDAQEPGALHVCSICGYILADRAGQAPGRCPVCQAVPEKFRRVEF